MKVKLLKKLRREGRGKVHILTTTTRMGNIVGMRYSFNEDEYSGLFSWGDTPEDVENKAAGVYMKTNIERIRKKYRKYSRRNKQ